MVARGSDLQIDHVTVAGTSLKNLRAALSSVGIQSEYGGRHANGVTEMAIVSFPDGSYLELIAPVPDADSKTLASHFWGKFMQADAGPCAWAVRSKDVAAEAARLKAAGVSVSDPARNGRRRPDGVQLNWEAAQVGAEGNGVFFPFLIHDFTARRQRAWPSGKPNAKEFTGVTKVVIAVRDLDDAVDRYRKAYDLTRPIKQVDPAFSAHLASLGGTPVVFAAPLSAQSWIATRLERFGEGPCAFLLGARKSGRTGGAMKTRWFGTDITWLDPEKVGWHLGIE